MQAQNVCGVYGHVIEDINLRLRLDEMWDEYIKYLDTVEGGFSKPRFSVAGFSSQLDDFFLPWLHEHRPWVVDAVRVAYSTPVDAEILFSSREQESPHPDIEIYSGTYLIGYGLFEKPEVLGNALLTWKAAEWHTWTEQ